MRFTAVQEQPEIPKHNSVKYIEKIATTQLHSQASSGQSVVPHNKLPNSIRVRTPFLTACHHCSQITAFHAQMGFGFWVQMQWPIH